MLFALSQHNGIKVNMNKTKNTTATRQRHHDRTNSQGPSQIDLGKEIVKTIFLCIVTSLVFWAMFHSNEGVATMYLWIGGFFAAMGGGIGIVIGLPWARRVSSWKRLTTL